MFQKEIQAADIQRESVLALIEKKSFEKTIRETFGYPVDDDSPNITNVDCDSIFQTEVILKRCKSIQEATKCILDKGQDFDDCLLVLGFACGLLSTQAPAQKQWTQLTFSKDPKE